MRRRKNAVAELNKHVAIFADDGRARVLSDLTQLLTVPEAAAYLRVSKSLLDKWRSIGGGPPYIRVAAWSIRYRVQDLLLFVEQRKRISTAAAERPADSAIA